MVDCGHMLLCAFILRCQHRKCANLLLMCFLYWLQVGFEDLEKWALSNPDPQESMSSGRQELAEIYLDMHVK